jgi:hypothetical protein
MIKYFLGRFLTSFIVFFIALVIIFASADIMIRISTLPSLAFVPFIFIYMVPFSSLFALPLASALAIQTTYGSFLSTNTYLLLDFFEKIKKKFYLAIAIFSLISAIAYGFVIFDLAPKSYLRVKKEILEFAKTHLSSLEPGKFHQPYRALTLFFRDKTNLKNKGSEFHHILISFKKEPNDLIFSAQSGLFLDNILILKNGSLLTKNKNTNLISQFEGMEINFEDLLLEDTKKDAFESQVLSATKFMTLEKLLAIKGSNNAANLEFHSRIIKTIWQLCFPLIAIFGALIINVARYSMITNIAWSGSLLLVSYLLIGMLGSIKNATLALFLMYGLSILFFLVVFYFGFKKIKLR